MPPSPHPRIDYPCRWSYRLIGREQLQVCAAVATIVDQQTYELSAANSSSKGSYASFELTVTVSSEEHRLLLFSRLADHADILYVL